MHFTQHPLDENNFRSFSTVKTMNKSNGGRAVGKNPKPKANDKCIKVKYISSPVMVEAKNASQFKEIVQHFTGQTPQEANISMYSNQTTTAAATTTRESTYEAKNTSPQVGIDSYSWGEIAEWNQY